MVAYICQISKRNESLRPACVEPVKSTIPQTLKNLSDFRSLLPAATCVVCGRTPGEIGGRRITAQKLRGMTVTRTKSSGGRENFRRWIRLPDGRNIYVLVWGEKSMMTEAVIGRIKTTYLDGFRPWFCQAYGCGNRQCSDRGKAMNLPVASDLLYDDGRNPHLIVIPADLGCVNINCKRFRDFGEGWEIVKYQAP